MLPATKKSIALASEWLTAWKQRAEKRRAAEAHAERQDAHVLHAGVGEHPLVVGLPDDQGRGHGHREQAEHQKHPLPEVGEPRGREHLLRAQDREEGAVEQRTREQRRDHRGRLAVRVGQPGVHRRQPHLGAVADQQEHEGGLEPAGIERPHPRRSITCEKSIEPPAPFCGRATARKKLPSSASAMPTEQISRYFQVASSERRWR